MLRLFHSIFRHQSQERYPSDLIQQAIDRAVDCTDPALRSVMGYRRKLRPAVTQAIDHVISMVDLLGPPLEISRKQYNQDIRLRNFFISPDHMEAVFSGDPELQEFLRTSGSINYPLTGLLVMKRQERKRLGIERQGAVIMRDVPQEIVSFDNHRLFDVTSNEEETRCQLRRRAFDHLLALALARITTLSDKRASLQRRRTLLQAKLEVLQREHWSFEGEHPKKRGEQSALHDSIDQIEGQLLKVGGDMDEASTHLKLLMAILEHPEEHIWLNQACLIVDDMGVKRSQGDSGGLELKFLQVGDSAGRCQAVSLFSLPQKNTGVAPSCRPAHP